jgi:hypothetical protein
MVCHDIAEVRRQLPDARLIAAETARQLGCLRPASAVPPIGASRMEVSLDERYGRMADDYR